MDVDGMTSPTVAASAFSLYVILPGRGSAGYHCLEAVPSAIDARIRIDARYTDFQANAHPVQILVPTAGRMGSTLGSRGGNPDCRPHWSGRRNCAMTDEKLMR